MRLGLVALRCGFRGGGLSGSGAVLTRLTAKCLTTAMFLAPWPLRRRDWSSAKTTLSTQCNWFSDAPMAAHGLSRTLCREPGRGDIVAGLEAAAVGKLGVRFDADDRRDVRQAQLARKAPLAIEPVDFRDDAHAALLDASMALVEIDECVDPRRGGESALDLGAQGRLIGFDRQQIVGALVHDRPRDLGVGGDGVDGDERARQRAAFGKAIEPEGMAESSLLLPSTASWPSTRRLVVAKAETRCSGALSSARSWLRREVFPSMAMSSGRSGHVSRTQAVKAEENNTGSTRI